MSRVRYITYHPFRRWGCPPLSSETPFCCVFGWGESWNSEEETTISTKKHTLREIVGFFGLNKMCGMNQFPMNTLSKVSVYFNQVEWRIHVGCDLESGKQRKQTHPHKRSIMLDNTLWTFVLSTTSSSSFFHQSFIVSIMLIKDLHYYHINLINILHLYFIINVFKLRMLTTDLVQFLDKNITQHKIKIKYNLI